MTKQEVDMMISCVRDIVEEQGYRGVPDLLEKLYPDIFFMVKDAHRAKIAFAYACIYCGVVLLGLDNDKIYNVLKNTGLDLEDEE